VHESGRFVFSAEVVAVFDPKNPQDVEIKSVRVYGETVDLSDRRGLP
jgi:hypothetical protein